MPANARAPWPVLKSYTADHLPCVALPLGGLGTGTVSLGGRGDLRDWEVVNRPAKHFTPGGAFFALYAKPSGGEAVCRALEGVLQPPYEGGFGDTRPNHGLPRFRECSFNTAYPLAQVRLTDPDVPVAVTLEAFNPLVPVDLAASSLPVAILRYRLENRAETATSVAVCGTVPNFIGLDGAGGAARGNLNDFREQDGLRGIAFRTEGTDPADERWGTLALATTQRSGVTWRTGWAKLNWGDSLLDFWDDFSADGALDEREAGGVEQPRGSLAARLRLAPGETKAVTFVLAWHFPNRMTWTPSEDGQACCGNPNRVGNHYTTVFTDAWDAAAQTAAQLDSLERRTVAFVRGVAESDLPEVVKEAALFNLSTLRSQTCFRTEDGHFFGWEGCGDHAGCCHGNCTHVWNYEQATAYLFGDLAWSMRELEFAHATDERGLMSFRVNLPLTRSHGFQLAAADGQMGCLLKLYREWRLSGDDARLKALWPAAKRALEFCWVPGGWDGDQDGVMEGCQHNTMDVEYYGPNPQMGGWYLGALRAGEELARHLGDTAFADRCGELFARGRAWLDAHLFNGEYYEHEIRPPREESAIAPGLRHETMGARDLNDPELQLGAGCLVDQLVGQFVAHVAGLGYLLDPEHVRTTLRSILKYNRRTDFSGHFNHMRSFVLNDETALVMATYPRGRRPRRPFPYYHEVMTGFEYAAAVHLLHEGLVDEGLACIEAIRARYDGKRRNPFDEAECGHHYARAMASWAAIPALTGFDYDATAGTLAFAASDGPVRWFWSTGGAWGELRQSAEDSTRRVTLLVQGGKLRLKRLVVTGAGELELPRVRTLGEGQTIEGEVG